jgi:hypothetical protein
MLFIKFKFIYNLFNTIYSDANIDKIIWYLKYL